MQLLKIHRYQSERANNKTRFNLLIRYTQSKSKHNLPARYTQHKTALKRILVENCILFQACLNKSGEFVQHSSLWTHRKLWLTPLQYFLAQGGSQGQLLSLILWNIPQYLQLQQLYVCQNADCKTLAANLNMQKLNYRLSNSSSATTLHYLHLYLFIIFTQKKNSISKLEILSVIVIFLVLCSLHLTGKKTFH